MYRLAYSGDSVRQRPDQLAVFQGASEAPISELIRAERVRPLPDRLHIDLDMRPLTASPARTALPVAHFERNDVIIICETVH